MFNELKVLELASVLAGPAVGQFFAELGASVIKVENLKTNGDVTRTWKTFGEDTDDRSAYFSAVNWGKRSISINLDHREGLSIVHELVRQSDIVVASYKPGDAKRLGVDYESVSKIYPKIIYGEISGYGSDDQRVGYDAVIQAESGFMFMNGEPGQASLKMPVALIDILAAHQLKEGILLAMLRQTKTGEGAHVRVSLLQAAISSLANQATNWLVGRRIPQKQGSTHPNISPYGDVFLSATGSEILLAIGTDNQFQILCEAIDVQQLRDDPKFATNTLRVQYRRELHEILQTAISKFSTDLLMTKLSLSKIPAGVIRSVNQVFELPAAKEIMLHSSDREGVKTFICSPFSENSSHFLPPPHIGEHTIEILSNDLKFDNNVIQQLFSSNIIR
ncbi:MAG: CaiB/BaiF CoA-transferase family protein [Chryseolinea sp.]